MKPLRDAGAREGSEGSLLGTIEIGNCGRVDEHPALRSERGSGDPPVALGDQITEIGAGSPVTQVRRYVVFIDEVFPPVHDDD